MDCKVDVIIIGAGIAGVSLASELSKDKKIIVLESEDHPGFHATGRSAATYLPTYGPKIILELTRASGDFLHNPPKGFCQTPLLSKRPTLMIAKPGNADIVKAGLGVGMKNLPMEQALKILPALQSDIYTTTLIDDETMDIDVDVLLQSHIKRAKGNGAKIVCRASVMTIAKSNENWHLSTPKGDFQAPIIVNAAGAWADQIAEKAGLEKLGLEPKRRSAALIDVSDKWNVADWPLAYGAGDTFYFRPMGGKLMISPADETICEPHDAWADDFALAQAVELFQEATGIEVTRLDSTWAGLRTFAPDGDPVVGFDNRAEGFFWLAGQGGYGIQTSPAISQLAASLIATQKMPGFLAGYGIKSNMLSPNRFLTDS